MPSFRSLDKMGEWLCEQDCGDPAMLLVFYAFDEPKGRAIVHGTPVATLLSAAPVSLVGCVSIRPAINPENPVEVTFGCFDGDEDDFIDVVDKNVTPRLRANQRPVGGVIRKNHNALPIVAFYRFRTRDGGTHDVLLHLWEYKPWQAAAIVVEALKDIRSWQLRPRRGLVLPPEQSQSRRRLLN